MIRLPRSVASRLLPSFTLACALAAAPVLCSAAWAADAATAPPPADQNAEPVPAPAPAEASPQDRQLRNDVDAYFHYAWIARYDLASQFAQKIVDESSDPAALVPILEDTAKLHDPNMGYMAQILLFDNQADLKAATDKLLLKVQAGNVTRAQDPDLIEQTIRDMSANERAYENHLPILRYSGELAVPVMIQFLRLDDDQHKPYRSTVRRALLDLGKVAVNPLLAATDSKERPTLLVVVDTLGNLGYDAAGPCLARLAADPGTSDDVKAAANAALDHLNVDKSAGPAQLYEDLAVRFYYGTTDIGQIIDNPGPTPATPVQTCNYWTWDAARGLVRAEVPTPIFNDLMALRTTEQALILKPDFSDAVSLWLDADNKREVDLPAGATDPVMGDQPPAHYFNVSSGARHLNDALARALKDNNAAVALKLTHSLGQIVGRGTIAGPSPAAGAPLTDALSFPDKRVRYEAACALASALPMESFPRQELVVPLLVDAIGEGGGGNLLVLGPNQDDANALQEALRKLGYVTIAAASPGDLVSKASNLPSVDAIIIARGVDDPSISQIVSLAGQAPQLREAVTVVLKENSTGLAAALASNNPLVSVTTQAGGDPLKTDIEAARAKAGLIALDPKQADAYAMRAATALDSLALSRNPVLDAVVGEPGLLSALDGPKPELVAAVGDVLAHLASKTAQQGLAQRALNDQATPVVRITLFGSLATSAKAFGNQLEDSQTALIQKEAVEIKENNLRSAAAEARGALNLPTDEARNLILNYTQGGN